MSAGEYRIGIGAATLGLRVVPRRYEEVLPGYFNRPSAPGTPDLRVTIRITTDPVPAPLPDSLYYGKDLTPGGFTLADRLVHGRNLARGRGVELRVPLALLGGHAIRIFEHLLHMAFHMAARARGEDCCLIHAAGVVRGGAGYLFVGASGAGKSTIARLSAGDLVLNDEICMVAFAGGPPRLHGTPFNGFFRDKVEGQAPLKAVFLLAQRDAHRLLPVGTGEAVSAVFQQVVPPVALDEPVNKAAYVRMLDVAARLLAGVPAYRLEFRQDAGFWSRIDELAQEGVLA